jgi:hypothetical protein
MSKRGNDSYSSYTAPVTSSSPIDECAELSFPTDLKKPQRVALSKAHPGDLFSIKLDTANTPWVHNFDDEPCGIIVSLKSPNLVECLKKGKLFEAAILKITSDVCSILVQPAKK